MGRQEPSWYALSAWPSRMWEVMGELRALGLLHYVPCETVERRVGRKLQAVRRPVWPGYVFVHCDLSDFGPILAIEGAHDFVREPEFRQPVSLWPNDLVPILLAEAFGDLDYTRTPEAWRPERGDKVRVRSGKWRGYLGRVLSVSKRKAIMQLESGFGKLTVDPDSLEEAA